MITEENRGKIRNLAAYRQEIDWSGLRPLFGGNRTPTDLDGFLDINNRIFLLIEFKRLSAEMPQGQKIALERIVDAVSQTKIECALFVASHNECVDNPINAAKAEVRMTYYRGQEYKPKGVILEEMIKNFLQYAEEKQGKQI